MTFQPRPAPILLPGAQAAATDPARGRTGARRAVLALTLAMAAPIWAATAALLPGGPGTGVALALLLPGLLWIAGGAATAILGLLAPPPPAPPVPPGHRPRLRTAILLTLCGEPPGPVAARLSVLAGQLARTCPGTAIFVLSDTPADRAAPEEAALDPLRAAGLLTYRRRPVNIGRKPGNIAQWFDRHGAGFDLMLVLDADSTMSAARILRMVRRMEDTPRLGLLQAGIGLVPGATRLARLQRLSARLLAPGFGAGLAAWSGPVANYYGHNALIRTRAFAAAARLPRLSGPAPWGGDILSHDFVEAALIARAGWQVVLDPDMSGSAEAAPETLAAFHRRDRRWCQGNLQHLRLIGLPGLPGASRVHLALGVFAYLAGPLWLLLVLLPLAGPVAPGSAGPLAMIAAVLAVPKAAGLWRLWRAPGATPWRRRVALRATLAETLMSALVAPIFMLRHAAAVLSVVAGRDCGWKGPLRRTRPLPAGLAEALAGLMLAVAAAAGAPGALPWLAPVIGPLLAAPVLVPWLDGPARRVPHPPQRAA